MVKALRIHQAHCPLVPESGLCNALRCCDLAILVHDHVRETDTRSLVAPSIPGTLRTDDRARTRWHCPWRRVACGWSTRMIPGSDQAAQPCLRTNFGLTAIQPRQRRLCRMIAAHAMYSSAGRSGRGANVDIARRRGVMSPCRSKQQLTNVHRSEEHTSELQSPMY